MKAITITTLILLVSVALVHNMTIFTKLIVGAGIFCAWALYAIVRTARARRAEANKPPNRAPTVGEAEFRE